MKNQNPNTHTSKQSFRSQTPRIVALLAIGLVCLLLPRETQAAGTMALHSGGDQPLRVIDHQVAVTLQNGFARTEVNQVFFNANQRAVEGLYTFPVPKNGSLSEVSITAGELVLRGEVVEKEKAEAIYQEETAKGNQAGLTQQDNYRDFEFWVAPIPAQSEVRMRFVYYEPLELDHGIGRYLYPLEEGGTDEVVPQFWSRNSEVEGNFGIEVELRSAWPINDVRTPGFSTTQLETENGLVTRYSSAHGNLNKDFVLYYRLQDDLPGRVEVIPFKVGNHEPGTFMMVVTPGIDLKPLDQGSDYVFVLDVSGSMAGKLGTLVSGVKQSIRTLRTQDRFRIVVFNDESRELTRGWVPATTDQLNHAMKVLEGARSGGGTNLYAGLQRGMESIDSDRVTSMILVTDGVTNTGIVDPREFDRLMAKCDVRFFGFLLGNQSNWPLMETVCQATGGYYKQVSNNDDIIGQLMLAKSKVLHESIHDFDLSIKGVETFDVSPTLIKKVFRGQQLVFFGRYAKGGQAQLEIKARIAGEDKVYATHFEFPDLDTVNPEIERLWALNRIHMLEREKSLGNLPAGESESAIADLAVQYQLVTDHTSMLVLSDSQFQQHGIERRNLARTNLEASAQLERIHNPVTNYRVDQNKPAFGEESKQSSLGSGGGSGAGAVSPWIAVFLVGFLGLLARRTFVS